MERLITYMKDPYVLSIKIAITLSMIYVGTVSLSCIHHRNIQSLAIEIFKVKKNLSNTIMSDVFPTGVLNDNLRSQTDIFRNAVITTQFGIN